MKLEAIRIINSSSRISSVDIFRSIAILSVVIWHFNGNILPYGFLGVDLFFVISGLLVGGLLTKEFSQGNKIRFFKFFLQRGFKIWPSYYAFILLGSCLAIFFYRDLDPDQIIPIWDLKRYLLFYQNYTGAPYHWSFDHVWSLCVEEHFYILLPILFLIVQYFIQEKYRIKALFIFVILTIVAGIIFKNMAFFLTNSQETQSATHNRIDALAWGVLLNLLIQYGGDWLRSAKTKFFALTTGLLIFIMAMYFILTNDTQSYGALLYRKIYFHSIIPVAFFLLLLGAYFMDFSKFKVLRFIAYYSYNWYLWHVLFVVILKKQLGDGFAGLTVYLFVTFIIAVIATIGIEEVFLKKRKVILNKLFRASPSVQPSAQEEQLK